MDKSPKPKTQAEEDKGPKKKIQALMKPVKISSELQAVIGAGPYPRSQITKKLWEYIKKHELQHPTERRKIKPDSKLGAVLKSSQPVDMFEMSRLVSKHITN